MQLAELQERFTDFVLETGGEAGAVPQMPPVGAPDKAAPAVPQVAASKSETRDAPSGGRPAEFQRPEHHMSGQWRSERHISGQRLAGVHPSGYRLPAPDDRLFLYRTLVQATLSSPMEKGFPFTRAVLGEEAWDDATRRFRRTYPPMAWELNATVAMFPTFLEAIYLPEHPEIPAYAAELADYERLELTIYLAPDSPWSGSPPLNPTLALRKYKFDIAGWVLETDGAMTGEPEPRPTHLAVYREPASCACRFLRVGALTAFVLEQLLSGAEAATLLEAVRALTGLPETTCAFQLSALLNDLTERGVMRKS